MAETPRPLTLRRRSRVRLLVALVIGVVVPLAGTGPATAAPEPHELTLMTQNLYQGTELEHVLAAQTPEQFAAGVATDYANVIATNFKERADALAAEIVRAGPALVGLQEVALWRTQLPFDPTAAPQTVAFDFLQILLDALAARGVTYITVIARDNFDVSGPGLFPFGLMGVRLTERTAIIARTDPRAPLKLSHPQQGGFQHVSVLPTLNGPFPLGGGWLSVDATADGRTFRFITTHLDGFSPAVAGAQTGELLAGPAATDLPVLIAGDFNSVTTDPAYGDLVAAGFTDVWAARNHERPGLTCCQVPPDSIVNPVSQLSTRIDYIFTSGRSAPRDVHVVGDNPSARTASGLWPSDHAGLVATLKLDKQQPPPERGAASPEG